MRVSEQHRYNIVNERVNTAKTDQTKALETLSTQKRINHLSDDPVGAAHAVTTSGRIEDAKQNRKNIEFSKGYVEVSETALASIFDNLLRAKDLAVSLANSTYGAESREAAGREIKEIISDVVSRANSAYGRRYVFSGFRTDMPALDTDGKFLGDDGAIFLMTGGDSPRQINLQARPLFEASADEQAHGHWNMVETLQSLYEGLMVNDRQMVMSCINELDHQMEKTTSARATLGARLNGLEQSAKGLEYQEELATADLSRIEDADVYQATSDFKRTEAALQSTLMASNKLLQPSLLNFMQ